MSEDRRPAGASGLPGRATEKGTDGYRRRFSGKLAEDHFRRHRDWWLSSIGIGTYLGEPGERDDAAYRDAVVATVRSGGNVIDTAVNYRLQRSERSVGAALRILSDEGFDRSEMVIATKGGFIPFDGEFPGQPTDWFRTALMEPGIASPDDVVANCHIMTPRYLESQVEWSRRNIGVETLDIYYLHNPETQLSEVDRPEFIMRIRAAFEMLERQVAAGRVGIYGVATWDGLRVPPEHKGHLSLRELLAAAEQVGGKDHHFRAVQAPLNLIMGEACLKPTQTSGGGRSTLLEAAADAGITVMASSSLLQGQVITAIPPGFSSLVTGAKTGAQAGLQVVRSAPGLATALTGMKSVAHVSENLGLAAQPRLAAQQATAILRACGGGGQGIDKP